MAKDANNVSCHSSRGSQHNAADPSVLKQHLPLGSSMSSNLNYGPLHTRTPEPDSHGQPLPSTPSLGHLHHHDATAAGPHDAALESHIVDDNNVSSESRGSKLQNPHFAQIKGGKRIRNTTELAVPFLRDFKRINRQRVEVQELRVQAGEQRGQVKEAMRFLSATGVQVVKVLGYLSLPEEEKRKISSTLNLLEDAVKEVDKLDTECDQTVGRLVPAEWSLKESERSLYGQIMGFGSQIPTETGIYTGDDHPFDFEMSWTIEAMGRGAEPPELGLGTLVEASGASVVENRLKTAINGTDDQQQSELAMVDASSVGETHQQGQLDADMSIEKPAEHISVSRQTLEPRPVEERSQTMAETRIEQLAAHSAHVQSVLAKLEADYAVLQEEAERRMVVGVPLDNFSQQRLTAYPQHRGMLWKELASIENEIASMKSLVGHGEANGSQASEVHFRLDQFNDTPLDDHPKQLDIDGDDGRPVLRGTRPFASQIEQLAARATDPAPGTSDISPPDHHFPQPLSTITKNFGSEKISLYAYVTFWILTCLEASWWTWARYASFSSLDTGKHPVNSATIRDWVLRRWSIINTKDDLPYHITPVHTVSLPTDENASRKNFMQYNTASNWSMRPHNSKSLRFPHSSRSVSPSPASTRHEEPRDKDNPNDFVMSSILP